MYLAGEVNGIGNFLKEDKGAERKLIKLILTL